MILYQNWLEHWKTKHPDIFDWEAESPLRYDGESISDFWKRFFIQHGHLAAFYNSIKMKKKVWDMKKAREGEYGRAMNAL